jgi:hypothetical protein
LKASSSTECQRVIAEAAQQQPQFYNLIAENEREQKELEAVEKRRCAKARAKHEHEIAVLKARIKAATAEAIGQMWDGEKIASESTAGNDMDITRDGEKEVHAWSRPDKVMGNQSAWRF